MKTYAIHIINESWVFDTVFNLFKPLLGKRYSEMVRITLNTNIMLIVSVTFSTYNSFMVNMYVKWVIKTKSKCA